MATMTATVDDWPSRPNYDSDQQSNEDIITGDGATEVEDFI